MCPHAQPPEGRAVQRGQRRKHEVGLAVARIAREQRVRDGDTAQAG